MENNLPSTLINELEEIIYVSDVDTYEVLFANDHCKSLLGPGYKEGKKCYQMIQGFDSPCSFCTNSLLKKDSFYTWEYFNPIMQRHFMLKDKLVDWHGKQARLEIAVDITERENVSRSVQEKLKTERTLVDCIRSLTSSSDLDQAMSAVLSAIGQFYQSDRAYVLELDPKKNTCCNTYEWCAPGAAAQKDFLKNVQAEMLPFWSTAMGKRATLNLYIEDLKADYPEAYQRMAYQSIERLLAVPFFMEEKGVGYLGVDNPHYNEDNPALLNSLTYFIVSEMYKRRIQAEVEHQSRHDALTGLGNRLQYSDCLHRTEKNPPDSIGVVFCDINGLKHINDTLGHERGDSVIVQTAVILQKSFPDEMAFRLSGDEFVILCPNRSHEEFLRMVSNAMKNFSDAGNSTSLGYAWEDSDFDVLQLIRNADERMYINKQNYYKDKKRIATDLTPNILSDLLKSLSERRFEMFLQPKADILTNEIIGAEALARYRDPEHGIVLPGKFIPILEHEKVIKYLDLFMFEEACRTLDEWQSQGIELIPISVNFSRITIMEPGLIDEIEKICSRYRIERNYIEIEITESVGDIERRMIADMGLSLKSKGFSLSLDDFGTQYTSMSMLTVMEPDILKLDRSLIKDLVANPKTKILIRRVIELCQDLNIKSIAEGVETRGQLNLLNELQCDLAQGRLFGMPIPRSEFEERFFNVCAEKAVGGR